MKIMGSTVMYESMSSMMQIMDSMMLYGITDNMMYGQHSDHEQHDDHGQHDGATQ